MNPKTKTLLLILLCFALGALLGYVGEKYYLDNRSPRRPDRAEMRREFSQRLRLDTVQIGQVDSVFDVHRKRVDEIRKLFSAELDSLRAGIRKLLRPDQGKLYDDYIKEMDSRDTRKRDGDKQPPK